MGNTQVKIIFLVVLAVAVFAFPVVASTPAEYVERVDSARRSVETLLTESQGGRSANGAELIAAIKRDVPEAETVEWSGGPVQTHNAWLHNDLKALAETSDPLKREAILTATSERLLAIAATARELQKTAENARGKDEDKQKLGEILTRPEYQKPEEKSESLFQKWWREFLEWLSRMFPGGPEIEPSSTTGFSTAQFVLQIVVFTAVAALILFLLYKFLPFFRRGFKSRKVGKGEDRVILGERIDDDQSALDLFGEAERLAREGDLRSAIRKGYIAMLCDLADRKLVRLDRSKTNRDYLRDVRRIDTLYDNVRGLTSSFEVNWYGLRPAEAGDWEEFRSGYERTVAAARRVEK